MNEAEMNIGLRPRAPRNTGRGDMSTEHSTHCILADAPLSQGLTRVGLFGRARTVFYR